MARKPRKVQTTHTVGVAKPEYASIYPDMKPLRKGGINKDYKRMLSDAIFWIHHEVDSKKLAAEFVKYCEKKFDAKEAKLLRALPDHKFSTIGKYTYFLIKGGQLEEEMHELIKKHYDELVAKAKTVAQPEVKEEKPKAPVISIQQRMREQVAELMGTWEGYLDDWRAGEYDLKKFDPYKEMVGHQPEVKPAHAKIIQDAFACNLAEAKELVAWEDEEIKEAYSQFTARAQERKQFLSFYEAIQTATNTIINTGKATRKTRVKKAPSKEKLIAKIKYKESESALGLASINPIGILEASVLWVYNTKNRKLGVYVADSLKGTLSVKGTTITDFDAAKSVQKTIRKPEELLKGADKLARTKIQKLFDEVRATETAMNGRINDQCILIKAF